MPAESICFFGDAVLFDFAIHYFPIVGKIVILSLAQIARLITEES